MQRKTTLVFILVLLLVIGLVGSAYADTGKVAIVQGDEVNLRSSPDTASADSIIGQVSKGARLAVVSEQGDWVQVSYEGEKAWIAGWLVQMEQDNTEKQTGQEAAGTENNDPAEQYQYGIEVYVNNQKVAFPDQEAFLDPSSERTYVPLRFVSEALGAKVDWNATQKTALVQDQEDEIAMAVGERVAKVNGQDRMLDAPAKLVNGRTMVPLRFVSEVLGSKVDWVAGSANQTSRVLIEKEVVDNGGSGGTEFKGTFEVEVTGEKVLITLKAQEPMRYISFELSNPERIVVDIEGFSKERLPDKRVSSDLVDQVRTGIVDGKFRLVSDLKTGFALTRYNTTLSADKKTLTIEIYKVSSPTKDRVVVLDAGHGGRDPGAIGPGGLYEKEVAWNITRETERLLREKNIEVVLTRRGDEYVELGRRAEIANRAQGDIFISIHSNSTLSPSVRGLETYYCPSPTHNISGLVAASRQLAQNLQNNLVAGTSLQSRGVKEARFVVLRDVKMPAALVEVGFLSNPEEEKLLGSTTFQQRAASAIVKGIEAYFNP